jgi:hypothetical protein
VRPSIKSTASSTSSRSMSSFKYGFCSALVAY